MYRHTRTSLAVVSAFGILAGGVAMAGPAAAAGPPEARKFSGVYDMAFICNLYAPSDAAAPVTATPADIAVFETANKLQLVYGTTGNDVINTGSGDQMIISYGGNDTIRTGSGNDYVCSGSGDDVVKLGSGKDEVVGGSGTDVETDC